MKKDYELEPSHLILGQKNLVTYGLEIASGNKVKRGDIIDENGTIITDSGKVFGIATEDVDASSGAKRTVAYVEGEFNIEKVNFGSADRETVIKLCLDRNIYLRNIGGNK